MVCVFRYVCMCLITFPNATADVAMSSTKLSPPLAGAATLMGLVPNVHSFPLVGTTSGEVLVKDIPWGGRQWVWQDVVVVSSKVGEKKKNLHSQSCSPSGPAWSSSQQCHSGWNLKWWIKSNNGVYYLIVNEGKTTVIRLSVYEIYWSSSKRKTHGFLLIFRIIFVH